MKLPPEVEEALRFVESDGPGRIALDPENACGGGYCQILSRFLRELVERVDKAEMDLAQSDFNACYDIATMMSERAEKERELFQRITDSRREYSEMKIGLELRAERAEARLAEVERELDLEKKASAMHLHNYNHARDMFLAELERKPKGGG